MEQRHGSKKPVIRKALVELNGKPFKAFAKKRDTWAVETSYLFPGAIQYYGPDQVCNMPTQTLLLERGVPKNLEDTAAIKRKPKSADKPEADLSAASKMRGRKKAGSAE
jgi:hypothetical protein